MVTSLAACGDDKDATSGTTAPPAATTGTEATGTEAAGTEAAGTEAAGTATTATTTTAPVQTIEDAQAAVDDDRYAEALAIAAALTAGEANSIRRRISNRYARRVRTALRSGDRARASFLLRQAARYPRTQQLAQASSSYKAAKERVAERARQRRLAAEQRLAQRTAAREREQQQEDVAPPASSVPSGTCADTPMTDFPVPPGDPRDRDGDGIACES